MYPSIPTDEAILIASNLLDKQKLMNLSINQLNELLGKYIKSIQFDFEGEFFTQNDGLPMGSPLSPILSEIFFHNIETQKLFPIQTDLKIGKYWRYVDDGLILTTEDIDEVKLLEKLNEFHPNIKFTIEKEINKSIHFLDVEIKRNNENIETKTYHKPCHPNTFNNWYSNVDMRYKIQAAKCQFLRANKICNTNQNKRIQFNYIKQCLINSNYPVKVIKKCEIQAEKQNNKSKPILAEKKAIYFGTTYLGNNTSSYLNNLKKSIARHGPSSVEIKTFTKSNIPLLLKFRKPRIDHCNNEYKTHCVYKINCGDCPECYIGETGRQLNTRIKEHKSYKIGKASATVNNHIHTKNHKIDYDHVEILKIEKDANKRKLWESHFISKNKIMDGNQCSVTYELFN